MRKRRAECINARPDPSVSVLRDLTDESLFSPEARREAGFDAKTVRVVSENATTLHFRLAEFEED